MERGWRGWREDEGGWREDGGRMEGDERAERYILGVLCYIMCHLFGNLLYFCKLFCRVVQKRQQIGDKNNRYMTSKEIRKAFLDFFASKGHQIVPSAPMVVKNEPTHMFTNAGMNQFKDWFL